MHLDSNKTLVLLWCLLLFLCSFQSPSEASRAPSGLDSEVASETVDVFDPQISASGNVVGQSSDYVASQVPEPLVGRHLVQRSSSSTDEGTASCQLTQSQRRKYRTRSTRVWNITDEVLEELKNDIQSIVSCAARDDKILFSTRSTIQPQRSIIISRNLTISSQPDGPLFKNGVINEAGDKVKLTCPTTGDLLVIRSKSALVANLIFGECNTTGNVISVETNCDEKSSYGTLHFLHVEFRNLVLGGDQLLFNVSQPSCTHLAMEHVTIRDNQCGTRGCLSVPLNSTLTDLILRRNRASNTSASQTSPSLFVLSPGSEIVATSILASANEIRLFYVVKSTLKLNGSQFDGNAIRALDPDPRTARGSVLFSVNSTINIQDSVFVNNSGWTGGAIYTSVSNFTAISCNFSKNDAGTGSGGALAAVNVNASMSNVTFSKNNASWGGACFFEVNSTLRVDGAKFEANHAHTDGGGIHARNSTVIVWNSSFHKNSVDHDGSAMYVFGGEVNVTDVNVTENCSSDDGAIFLSFTSSFLDKVLFQRNRMNSSGGGIYMDSTNITITNATFDSNYARHRGGAISARVYSRVRVLDTFIRNNVADIQGGGIHGVDIISMEVSTTCIYNNHANYGGGIFASIVRSLTLSTIRLENNNAIYGGACFFEANSTSRVNGTTFVKNHAQTDGGAIQTQNSILTLQNSSFCSNSVIGDGSALHVLEGSVFATDVNVTENFSHDDGAMYLIYSSAHLDNVLLQGNAMNNSGGGVYLDNSNVNITHGIFDSNYVQANGGAIYAKGEQSKVQVNNTVVQNNSAGNHGGGIYALDLVVMHLTEINLTNNNGVTSGGGIYISYNTRVSIINSTISQCTSRDDGGGIRVEDESNLTMSSCIVSNNRAKNGGGIYVTDESRLNATNISMHSNVAIEDGGGMGLAFGSSLLCTHCNFTSNVAGQGGGMTSWADNSSLLVAQLQNSTFENNIAYDYGGGLFFMRPANTSISYNASNTIGGHIRLLNTTFEDNVAGVSGSAILTYNPEGILVSCNHMEPQYDFLDQNLLHSLDPVHPKKICRSWTGNRLATNATELIVSTFGRYLSFSIEHNDNIWMDGDVASGFVLENVTNGKLLPVIRAIVLDAYGNGPSYVDSGKIEATMESPNGFFNETRMLTIINGSGVIVEIFNHRSPGNYSIKISPNANGIQDANIVVNVRECQVGEERTSLNFCQPCTTVSYNFNPMKEDGCSRCPSGANCDTRYIVPKDGYWHKGPCHAKVQQCLIEEACTYGERQQELGNYTANFSDCKFKNDTLKKYGDSLCKDGYKGPLCGSCSKSYGLSVQFKCLECPHAFGSVLTLIGFTFYLLVIASITIRGGLPLKLKKTRANTPSESIPSETPSKASSLDEQVVNLEMIEIISLDRVTSADIREYEAPCGSTTQLPIQSNEPELTRWITTEIFKVELVSFLVSYGPFLKVMINFLQVTAVAASLNVEWTERILDMFEATEYVGALSLDALSRPIDCLISSDSSSVRSIWRTSLNLFVPVVVVSIFIVMWGFITYREKKSMSYFLKRAMLSVMAVTYIAYLGLTKLGIRVFYCVDVYDSIDNSPNSHTSYWAVDTSIKCYEKDHIGLMAISIFVLAFVSFSFPLISAIYLFQAKVQPDQTDKWTHETMGFLYRAFKEKYVFWESVVMFRKACLSLTVVFSYPLGSQAQGLLALGVLLLCLYLQQTCFPYGEDFHKLNYYESSSLLVSCFTFILGQFFAIEQCTNAAKTFVEVLTITLNTTFFTFLLAVLFKNVMNHIRAVLKFKNFPIDDNTPWWRLLKLFIKSKRSKATLPQH